MAKRYEMTIGGQAVTASTYQEILNPADLREVVGLAPQCDMADLDRAVEAAEAAFETWSKTSDQERQNACNRVAEIITANSEELAKLLTREQGKPLGGMGSQFEVGGCAGWSAATAGFSLPPKIIQDDNEAKVEMHRVPVGVVGSITPWNWPLLIGIWHMLPAIRSGNAVVIKPSPFTPLGTLRLVELMNEVLPDGLVNVVSGGNEIGAAMSAHPGISKIVFTGSISTGEKIMAASAPTMKRLTLELGGNDAGIVLPGTDPSAIVEGVFGGAFINSGQTCAALKRLYVHESIYEEMCDALVAFAAQVPMGNGLEEGNVLGPLQNSRQLEIVKSLVDDARSAGARILIGGEAPESDGFFYPATLIADAEDGMRIVDEEQFGPVLPIIKYESVDDAVDSANGLDFGLGASVWSADFDKARQVAERIEAGTVFINQHAAIAPHVPFGGIKKSGIGVEFGEEGLEAYTNIKIYYGAK